MRKIVFVSPIPLSDRVRRDWHVNDLIAVGAAVEYWDGSALWGYRGETRAEGPDAFAVRFADFRELRARFERPEYRHAIFVIMMNYEARYHDLFRLLTRLGLTTCIFEWAHLPPPPADKARALLALAQDPLGLPSAVYGKLRSRAFLRLGLIKPFDLVFAAGESALRRHTSARRIVPVNMCDYESYRAAAGMDSRLIPGRYGLFMDSNHPVHPDRGFVGMPAIDADRYFASLNRFFGLLEKKFGFPLAVALHPKSTYGSERFEGRVSMSASTPALVKDAEFVVCHCSTSMGYAVLAGKPIFFIYTDDMARAVPGYPQELGESSKYLRMPMLNIDRIPSDAGIVLGAIDPERYARFKYDFLTSPLAERLRTWDVVVEELRRLGPGQERPS